MPSSHKYWYSKQGLWTLFLMCAFPLHAWTIILALRDFSWVTERTNAWDAFGVASYGLLFAFVESLLLFIIFALLGFLISRHWAEDRRIALLSLLFFIATFWAMMSQLYYLLGITIPVSLNNFMVRSNHPVRILYGVSIPLITFSVLFPVYLVLKSDKFFRFMRELIDRLSLLTTFYLFFDVVGLVIVIIRNI
jgi:hypothetical protein